MFDGLTKESVTFHKCDECRSADIEPCYTIEIDPRDEAYYHVCQKCIINQFSVFNEKYPTSEEWLNANEKEIEKERREDEAYRISLSEELIMLQISNANDTVTQTQKTLSTLREELEQVKEKKRKFHDNDRI